MGMSTYVVGFKPPDDKWNKMKEIWETCEGADVSIPDEVFDFFEYEEPGDKPVMEVKLGDACKEWGNESSKGYEVDVSKLPKDVKFIRFVNSW